MTKNNVIYSNMYNACKMHLFIIIRYLLLVGIIKQQLPNKMFKKIILKF